MQSVHAGRVDLDARVDGAADHLEVDDAADDLFVEHDVGHVVDELEPERVLGVDFLCSSKEDS